jgi:hypothetical protein
VRCTHVDALRFFAPAAAPLNRHGGSLERLDQLRLEQPACVHAHMDLLKIALRLTPWVPAEMTADALELALECRKLDVAASPYDASAFGIQPIKVETEAGTHSQKVLTIVSLRTKCSWALTSQNLCLGRRLFRERQLQLMERAQPLRASLMAHYLDFLANAFSQSHLSQAVATPNAERFSTAQPGGLPWRLNLI